jgi:hypothetical protein
MQINFYPEHDNPEFEKDAKEYAKIWEKEGNKITETIEKISGLKFKEKIINAIIYDRGSESSPLSFGANVPIVRRKGTFVHELCHRLIFGNNVLIKSANMLQSWDSNMHKQLDLILYDILIELYGEDFAKDNIDYEISLWRGKDISPYKIAWDWALAMTKKERQKLWKKSLKI